MSTARSLSASAAAIPKQLLWAMLVHALFLLLRAIIMICDTIFLRIRLTIDAMQHSQPIRENGIHRQQILARHKMRGLDFSSEREFITLTVDANVDPEAVLRSNVQIYCLNESFAYFVVLPKPRNAYLALNAPFARLNYFLDATDIIKMTIENYERISAKLPEDFTCLLLMTSARCGTTLLTRMLSHASPESVVLACPGSLTQFCFRREHREDSPAGLKRRQLLAATLKMILKPDELNVKRRSFVIKLMSFEAVLAPEIHVIYPECVRFVFITREAKANILSWRRTMYGSPFFSKLILTMRYQRLISNLLKSRLAAKQRRLARFFEYKLSNILFTERVKNALHLLQGNPIEASCALWTDAMCLWQQNKRFYEDPVIIYDDLVRDPVAACEKVIAVMQNNRSSPLDSGAILKELETDSQSGTPFSKRNTSTAASISEIDYESLARMQLFWKAVGLEVEI